MRMPSNAALGVLVLLAVGAAVFRVATAPDRIRERHETARSVCLASGGQWVQVGRDLVCERANAAGSASLAPPAPR